MMEKLEQRSKVGVCLENSSSYKESVWLEETKQSRVVEEVITEEGGVGEKRRPNLIGHC